MNEIIPVSVKLKVNKPIPITIGLNQPSVEVKLGGLSNKLPNYTGSYTVTPKVEQVVLPTKNRSMLDDVTIFQIPYSSVTNPAGGETITIGLE